MFSSRAGGYIASEPAAGPWLAGYCHGGAVAAILVNASAAIPTRAPMQLARLTLDFAGPVPIGEELTVTTKIEKDGRKSQLLSIQLSCGGATVARGTILRIRAPIREARGPESSFAPDPKWRRVSIPCGFAEQFDIIVEKGGFGEIGPGRLWFHWRTPFIDGRMASVEEQAVGIADFANGFGMDLSFADWSFPTLDLSVLLLRPPTGDWIVVDAQTHQGAEQRAYCIARLEDQHGLFGHCTQTVFVERREIKVEPMFGRTSA
jgi:acyl-coenzyme A thioesterase PaaI-like protein